MIKIAHIYASNAKINSGDFMIGISTKKYFKEKILKTDKEIKFTNLDCRKKELFNNSSKLNCYDYIIVGSGGLILPDSSPNKISCWQWLIHKNVINNIVKPIYVISIGWNLFFGQNMNMIKRENNYQDKTRLNIFKENITVLIKKSKHFTLRHNSDVNNLLNIVGQEYKEKVKYEMCPTVWYVNKYWKSQINPINQKYIAIEIKDDRQWRRYHKIGMNNYYNKLLQFVKKCINEKKPILYLSHDGSRSFYDFLRRNKVNIPFLNNNSGNEKKILDNYSKIHTIYCSAGHSQMMSYGLGIKIISLISHPKLKNFCDDIGDKNGIDINNDIEKLI
tara:strand:- start:53 stop:1051 length:999 start_codon:yes stop_codon:yes gene_type:complete